MSGLRDDRMFRALADARRRRMLDLIRARPGVCATDLAPMFPFSRIALLKHLRVLEAGGLLRRRRRGKTKALYVREAPLDRLRARLGVGRRGPKRRSVPEKRAKRDGQRDARVRGL